MATSTQAVPEIRASGVLARWHLLSLDAPTVAVVWTWFVARAEHVRLGWASPVAMGLAVWMLYAGDRLLDARGVAGNLEARHLFHSRHRRGFLWGIGVGAVALAGLLPRLDGGAVHLYLSEGVLLFAWFVVLHGTGSAARLPKEIATGIFFAAAIFIPTVAREPGLRAGLAPVAILFAGLCSLNCLFIYKWEDDGDGYAVAHSTTRWAVRHLGTLAVVVAITGVGLAVFDPRVPRVLGWAVGLACLGLLGLDRGRGRLTRVTLRSAADLVLLTPVVFLGVVR